MTNYLELPAGPEIPSIINAVIEIPKGSANKYEYDKTLNVFKLDRRCTARCTIRVPTALCRKPWRKTVTHSTSW